MDNKFTLFFLQFPMLICFFWLFPVLIVRSRTGWLNKFLSTHKISTSLLRLAAKLKKFWSCNSLIPKLAGTSWAANANALYISAINVLFSLLFHTVARCWLDPGTHILLTENSKTPRVWHWDVFNQLRFLLPVPANNNIDSPHRHHKAAADNMIYKISAHPDWPVSK